MPQGTLNETTYLNHSHFVDSDRDQRPESRYKHGEHQQSNGSRTDGEKPVANFRPIRDKLHRTCCHSYLRCRNARRPQLGTMALRDLERDRNDRRLCDVAHEGHDDSQPTRLSHCRILPLPAKCDIVFYPARSF